MSADSWNSYTDEEKKGIIQSLPPTRQPKNSPAQTQDKLRRANGNDQQDKGSVPELTEQDEQVLVNPPLLPSFISSDPYLKRAIARFKRDVADGYYEKTWQDKARKSHQDRHEGKFDAYLEQHTEEMFVDVDDESEEDNADELGSDGEYTEGRRGGVKNVKMNGSMTDNGRGPVDATSGENATKANMTERRAAVSVK